MQIWRLVRRMKSSKSQLSRHLVTCMFMFHASTDVAARQEDDEVAAAGDAHRAERTAMSIEYLNLIPVQCTIADLGTQQQEAEESEWRLWRRRCASCTE